MQFHIISVSVNLSLWERFKRLFQSKVTCKVIIAVDGTVSPEVSGTFYWGEVEGKPE